ncbi:MAG: discoidin domain-containing protein, partial [Bacteroidota bacterium]
DGFSMWPSAYTEHSVKNSPWKDGNGDVVRELADACRDYGLKMGLYLSPWDRNHRDYGRPAYIEYFRNQLRELLTNYGEVFELWFDGANGGTGYYGGANEERKVNRKTYYDWPTTYEIAYELQPDIIIFSDAGPGCRWVGNEEGWANETNWSLLRKADVYPGMPDYKQLRSGHEDGTHWIPAECDVSIRPGWYYHPYEDHKVKTLSRLVDIYYHSIGRNANLLLNIPVDRTGQIHPADSARLMELKAVIEADFREDLARGQNASADQVRGLTKETMNLESVYGPDKVVDGDPSTYWTTADSITRANLVLDFGAPTTFNRVLLQEYIPFGQRVQQFSVEARIDNQWREVAFQSTIGYKRILRFESVTATQLRIKIKAAKANPLISNLEVYLAPALVVPPVVRRDKKGLVSMLVPEEEVEIYYTLNGNSPRPGDAATQLYRGEFMLREPTTVTAIAYDPETKRKSSLVTKDFDLSKGDWRVVKVSSGDEGKAGRIIDGNPDTWWSSPKGAEIPYELVIDLGQSYELKGLTYLPMQERYPIGFITQYEILVSKNRLLWGKPVAEGEFSNIQNNPIEQTIGFLPKEGRFVKIRATASADGRAGFAEIGVITR